MNIKEHKEVLLTTALALLVLSGTAMGQSVEKIYAGNSCNALSYDTDSGSFSNRGTWHYNDSGNQSLDAGDAGTDDEYDVICPIVRQKVGSSAGAKFFVYVDEMTQPTDEFECTMTSRRPHNGALVSSGSRLRTGAQANSNDENVLARSIAPSSTFGHYSLECRTNDNDPAIHSYRIKEF